MKTILFVTGSERKLGEARLACEPQGIEVIDRAYDIDEIQSTELLKISEHKAREAHRLAGQAVVVADTSWNIPALGGFPGAYMKDVAGWLSERDFLSLVDDKDDRRVSFTESITYFDGDNPKHFTREFWGQLVEPRGTGNTIENIAEFDGKTLGERRTDGGYSHDPDDYVWGDFAKWYSAKL